MRSTDTSLSSINIQSSAILESSLYLTQLCIYHVSSKAIIASARMLVRLIDYGVDVSFVFVMQLCLDTTYFLFDELQHHFSGERNTHEDVASSLVSVTPQRRNYFPEPHPI